MPRKAQHLSYRILYETNSETVVLLHGFLGSSEIWQNIIPAFEAMYRILLIDLPGHGHSAAFKTTISMSDIAKQIFEVLKHSKIHKAHFVGHSMGGYVGLEILNQKPDLVKSLTLLNSTAAEDSVQKKKDRLLAVKVFDRSPEVFISAAIENLFHPPSLLKCPSEVERIKTIALNTSVDGAKGSLLGMRERSDYVALITTTNTPTHFIAGRYDNTVPYDSILSQTNNSKTKLTTLESGHMGFIESLNECSTALVTFISQNQ